MGDPAFDLSKLRVAILGANGFIGQAVTRAFIALADRAPRHLDCFYGSRGVPPALKDAPRCHWRPAQFGEPEHPCWRELASADVVINLVGLKREGPRGGFEELHHGLPRQLVEISERTSITHIVHLSVAGCRPGTGCAYLETKYRGEQALGQFNGQVSILRPGVVWGPGDDMARNLVRGIRHAPVMVSPNGGGATIQTVHVDDLAAGVLAAVAKPDAQAKHACFDLVHPDATSLRTLVRQCAEQLRLPTYQLPIPALLLQPDAAVMERLSDPPMTRSQLFLLTHGVQAGDPGSAVEALNFRPRAFAGDGFATATLGENGKLHPPLFGVSLRAVSEASELDHLLACGQGLRPGRWLSMAILGLLACLVSPFLVADPWLRAGGVSLVQLLCLLAAGLTWRPILADSWSRQGLAALFGLLAAALLWLAGLAATSVVLPMAPALAAQLGELQAWAGLHDRMLLWPALTGIVLVEELFWRSLLLLGGITWLAQAGHSVRGLWLLPGSALAFALGHLWVGPPLLLVAALACGFVWGWILLRTRSLWAAFTCHFAWDACVMWLAPYST